MRRIFLAHDIGGAELLVAYKESRFPNDSFLFICDGPAAELFSNKNIPILRIASEEGFPVTFKEIVEDFRPHEAYCSTGLTKYETVAIRELVKHGIKTTALVEHWTNYRERFGYPAADWKENLPDRILFFDEHAIEIAEKNGFPKDRIFIEDNPLVEERKLIFNGRRRKSKNSGEPFVILYLSDLIADSALQKHNDIQAYGFTEITVFDDLIDAIEGCGHSDIEIVIRCHPAEESGKFDDYVAGNVAISSDKDLLEDIANADICVGSFTSALVTACHMGTVSCSYMPNANHDNLLEGMDISHLPGIHVFDNVKALRLFIKGQLNLSEQIENNNSKGTVEIK